jgi:hypothetical protein
MSLLTAGVRLSSGSPESGSRGHREGSISLSVTETLRRSPHGKPEVSAAWELMSMAAQGLPVSRGDLRKAIRRARPMFDRVLDGGDLDDPDEMGVAAFRVTVIFGALGHLWSMEPHEVEELWTSGLLDTALRDEFKPRAQLHRPAV